MNSEIQKLKKEKEELLEALSIVMAWCNLGIDEYMPVWAKGQWYEDCEKLHKTYNKHKNQE